MVRSRQFIIVKLLISPKNSLLIHLSAARTAWKGRILNRTLAKVCPRIADFSSKLGRLSSLETLNLGFKTLFGWHGFYCCEYNDFNDSHGSSDGTAEMVEQIQEAERALCWRAMMVKTLDCLAAKETVTMKRLSICELESREVSSFTTPAWHRFLDRLG